MNSVGMAQGAVRGGVVTLASQAARFCVQFLALAVMSRLLPPAAFGLVAMVTAILGLGDVIRDLGLSAAAVQAKSLTSSQATSLFWLSSGAGLVLSMCSMAAAWPIAAIYADERLVPICLALSLTLFFNGVQAQFQAQLSRSFRFRALALSDLGAQSLAAMVGCGLAWKYGGYWAIVWQLITASIVLLLTRWALSEWRPGRFSGIADIRSQISYGKNLTVTQILVYLSSNIDSVLVGRTFGPQTLGFYNRAFQLLVLPLNQIFAPFTSVALPVLSSLQDDRARYERYLQRANSILVSAAALGLAWMAAISPVGIPLVLGPDWKPSVLLFQIFAVGGLFQVANYSSYWVYLSLGLTREHLQYSLLSRAFQVCLILVASFHGVVWVAVAYTASMVLAWPASLCWLRIKAGIDVRVLLVSNAASILGASAAALAGVSMGRLVETRWGEVAYALATTAGMAVALSLMVISTATGRQLLRDARHTGQIFRGRGGGSS